MSMLLMVKAMGVKVGNSTSKFVLLKLADNANDKGECFPSYQHIADHCEISRRSAINHVNTLCEQGFVRKVYRKGEKGNSSNIFILTLDGEKSALGSENSALGGELDSLPPSEKSAPRTSHSFESVNESKKINKKSMSSTDDVNNPKKISIDFNGVMQAYREVALEDLSLPEELNPKRKKAITKIAKLLVNPEVETFRNYFERFMTIITNKPFYRGGQSGNDWKATFDYVLREDTLIKTREGSL